MGMIEEVLALIDKVQRHQLPLEIALDTLSSNRIKPYLSEGFIERLREAATGVMPQSPKAGYILSAFAYRAAEIKQDRSLQASCGLTLGCALERLGRFRESIGLLEQVLTHPENQNRSELTLQGLTSLGVAYFSLGEYDKAIQHHQQVLKMARDTGNRTAEAAALCNLGGVHGSAGEHATAIEYEEQALQISRKIGNREGEGATLASLGVSHVFLGNYTRAIAYYTEALKAMREVGDRQAEATILGNLGNACFCLGEYSEAIRYNQQALEISVKIMDRKGEANRLGDLGIVHSALGQYSSAVEYYQQSLRVAREIGDRKAEGTGLSNLGETYLHLADYPSAINYLELSLENARNLGNRQAEGVRISNIGSAHLSLGNHSEAIKYYTLALKLARETGDQAGEGYALGGLGTAYHQLEDDTEAIKHYQQALAIAREVGDRRAEGSHLGNLGNAYRCAKEYSKSIEHMELGLRVSREIGIVDSEKSILANLGRLYDLDLKQDAVAYDYYRKSLELTEDIRAQIMPGSQKSSFFSKSEDVYHLMISVCNRMSSVQPGKLQESFEYLERCKSRTLLELFAYTSIEPSTEIPQDLATREKRLVEKVRTLYLESEKQNVPLMASMRSLQSELEKVWNEMEAIDPDYVSIRRGSSLSYQEILQLLRSQGEGVCLVEYFLIPGKALIFVLRSDKGDLVVEEVSVPNQSMAYYFRKYLEEVPDFGRENIGEAWQGFSKYLINPIVKHLRDVHTIYFVPHRVLHYLPLHALKHDGEYLIRKYKILYSPSASIISRCQAKRRAVSRSFRNLVLGTGTRGDSEYLRILIEEEADRVGRLLGEGSLVCKGAKATKDLVKRESEGKDIIHFSCHGFFHPQIPVKSGLLLADEEILTAEDIFQLRLDASLITLSACQTGMNEIKPGDDLVGLTRSFFYAGTPSVVVSLWKVSADSTVELMERFYTYLKEGKTKVEALQKAQLDIMNHPEHPEWSHPYYWAPFILVGDWK